MIRNIAWFVLVRSVVLALHVQTVADLLGADSLKRFSKTLAASAARGLKNLAKDVSQPVAGRE